MPSRPDYYAVLGVSRTADQDEIKKAFRAVAMDCHPDRTRDDPAAVERFKRAQEAYEVLSDPAGRRRYDRGFAPVESVSQAFVEQEAFRRVMRLMLPKAKKEAQDGMDLATVVPVNPDLLIKGGTVNVPVPERCGDGPTIEIDVPIGVAETPRLVLAKFGESGHQGGQDGDHHVILVSKK
jgi:DnaJ-class molecular chaperone